MTVSKFISTTEGFLNANHITRVWELPEPRKEHGRLVGFAIEYVDPSDPPGVLNIAYTWRRSIDLLTGEIVPAAPGYSVVMIDDEDNTVFTVGAVIAWNIDELMPSPITDAGHIEQDYAILEPNGEVVRPFVCRYPNLEVYREAIVKEREAEKVA
jgi:hypothetical protein